MSDRDLLRRYVEASRGSDRERNHDWRADAAFAQLVNRHMGLVYGTCRRDIGDPQLAEDVTQVVFLLLARKASALVEYSSITGWLFKTARFASRNALRKEAIRRQVEQRASAMVELTADSGSEWRMLEPYVNDGLASLSATDRDAIILRYFEGRSYREIGVALATSEDGARVRTNRAIEKLRRYLSRRNIGIAAAILATLLAGHAAEAAPERCIETTIDAVHALTRGKSAHAIPSHTLARMKLAAKNVVDAYLRRQLGASIAAAAVASLAVMLPVVRYNGPDPNLSIFSMRANAVADSSAYGSNGVDLGGGNGYGAEASSMSAANGPRRRAHAIGGFMGSPSTGQGSRERIPLFANAGLPDSTTMSTEGGQHVYSVPEVLQSEDALNPLASPRQQDLSIRRAMRRTVVKDEPRGFAVTISAQLKHPLTPPPTP